LHRSRQSQKSIKPRILRVQGFKVIDVDTPKKLVISFVMIRSVPVPTCQFFNAKQANTFLDKGTPL